MRIQSLCFLLSLCLVASTACAGPTATTYTYQEGERTVAVYIDSEAVAELDGAAVRLLPVPSAEVRSALKKGSLPKSMQSRYAPVFSTAPAGGRRMVLTGGVIIYLPPTWTAPQVQTWLAAQKLEAKQIVNPEKNGYLLVSAPGLASLDLATRLLKLPDVVTAKPLWWQETSQR